MKGCIKLKKYLPAIISIFFILFISGNQLYGAENSNIKLVINIFVEKNEPQKLSSEEIGKLISNDLVEAMSAPEFKITPVKNFVTKEQFTDLTEAHKYGNLTEEGYDYLLFINIGLTGEKLDQMFIEGSFFNTITEKPYGTFSRSYTRGAIEQFDIFLLNSITELEMYFSPFRKIIEEKELPVTGTVIIDKNELYLPGNEKITGTVSELLNKYGENIRDYKGNNLKVAVRLAEGSFGQINSEKNNWNIISPDEKGELKFTYIPPAPEAVPQDGVKDIIEVSTFMYGMTGKNIASSSITLHKETGPIPSATPAPIATQTPVTPGQIISGKNLMLNLGFTHYNYIHPLGNPRDKGQDYAEVLILADKKPLTGASLKVFSFEPGKKPPTSEILKDTLSGGVAMKEINDGYYCIGYVPVLGEFSPVTFYPGGNVILIIRYNGNLIGMKSFPVPSFSIKMPEQGKTYPAGNKLKASLSSVDKNKNTTYNWYNYKIDRNRKRTGIELPAQSGTSVTYKPSTIEGKETDNILKVKASINGSTDLLSPDGYWVYNISTIQEIWYRVKPSGEKSFSKWKYLKDEIKNRGIRSRNIQIKH